MDIVTLQSQIDELKQMEITDITKLAKMIGELVKTTNAILDRLEVIEKRTITKYPIQKQQHTFGVDAERLIGK